MNPANAAAERVEWWQLLSDYLVGGKLDIRTIITHINKTYDWVCKPVVVLLLALPVRVAHNRMTPTICRATAYRLIDTNNQPCCSYQDSQLIVRWLPVSWSLGHRNPSQGKSYRQFAHCVA